MALSYAEIAWAKECLRAGDTLAEIADACECSVLDLARDLGVYGWVPRSLRWRQSVRGEPCARWIGGMLREVAHARCAAGEKPTDLASIAQVSRSAMDSLCRGLVKTGRKPRTACPQGHPYTPENTGHSTDGRYCKACRADRRRRTAPICEAA